MCHQVGRATNDFVDQPVVPRRAAMRGVEFAAGNVVEIPEAPSLSNLSRQSLIVTARQVFNFGDQNASLIVTRFAAIGTGRNALVSDANDDVATAEHKRMAESGHQERSASVITPFPELTLSLEKHPTRRPGPERRHFRDAMLAALCSCHVRLRTRQPLVAISLRRETMFLRRRLPMMPSYDGESMDTDRNLLFGVLALQADMIDAERFAEVCSVWASKKGTPLADCSGGETGSPRKTGTTLNFSWNANCASMAETQERALVPLPTIESVA